MKTQGSLPQIPSFLAVPTLQMLFVVALASALQASRIVNPSISRAPLHVVPVAVLGFSLKTPQEGLMPCSQRIFAQLPYLAGQ